MGWGSPRVTVAPAKTRVPAPAALDRPRLRASLEKAWEMPVTMVVAPAGSGKTTLLAQFAGWASRRGRAITWYRAEAGEGELDALLAHLESSMRELMPGLAGRWSKVADAAAALEAGPPAESVLVIDDLHTLAGTPAEAALEQLIAYLPSWLHLVVASRRLPTFDLSRLRVSGRVFDVGPDALRFRTWEVEDLFRHHYHQAVPPEELAELARLTEGWAAGLQLFHLATKDKQGLERRAVLGTLSRRWPEAREYLTRNILDDLGAELRDFLVRTCVLGRMAGRWCDQLLGTNGSQALLAELQYRHLFVTSDDGGATYRAHEVLRSHLEELLVEQLGEAGAREQYRRAAHLLEEAGACADALRAYCRAEDWTGARRLLEAPGQVLFESHGAYVRYPERLPPALADHDAWIGLAAARRQLAEGRWDGAIAEYRRCEDTAQGPLAADIARRERFNLLAWLDPGAAVAPGWVGTLRRALCADPAQLATELADGAQPLSPENALCAATAALLSGDNGAARGTFDYVRGCAGASPALAGYAWLGSSLCAYLAGAPGADRFLLEANRLLEPVLAPWTGRLLDQLATGRLDEALVEARSFRRAGPPGLHPWAKAVLALFEGCLAIATGDPQAAEDALLEASQGFGAVDAQILASCAMAIAERAGTHPPAHAAAEGFGLCERLLETCNARTATAGVRAGTATGAEPLTTPAGPGTQVTGTSGEVVTLGTAAANISGTAKARAGLGTGAARGPKLQLSCFGRFELVLDHRQVETAGVKPKERTVLHVLALNTGDAVHRHRLCALAWPDSDPAAATHSLHVAVSSLRSCLAEQAGPGAGSVIARVGDGYCLRGLEPELDLQAYDQAVARAKSARSQGHLGLAADAFKLALEVYRGELLPDAGDAGWVIELRERYRLGAAETAESLASCLLRLGDTSAALDACERGLAIDRYRDGLWQVLAQAHEVLADRAGAARARQAYREVLRELGCQTSVRGS